MSSEPRVIIEGGTVTIEGSGLRKKRGRGPEGGATRKKTTRKTATKRKPAVKKQPARKPRKRAKARK